jgi:hypothetical protein
MTVRKKLKKPNIKKAVQHILDLIAQRHNRTRGDVIVAESCTGPNGRPDISVYAVRQWLSRGIPKKHWETVANLAGIQESEVARIHSHYR